MELDEAMRRRKEWGDKPCDHPELQPEYYRGTPTGQFVCTQCGKMVDLEQRGERQSN